MQDKLTEIQGRLHSGSVCICRVDVQWLLEQINQLQGQLVLQIQRGDKLYEDRGELRQKNDELKQHVWELEH